MTRCKSTLLWLTLAFCGAAAAQTSVIEPVAPVSNYRAMRTWHEQYLATSPDQAARVDALRKIIREGRLGERGLQRIFNNFEGRMAIDPTIPGVEKTARLLGSPNRSQVKGHMRELLYAARIHNDGRYALVDMGRTLRRSWGRTDADIVVRHLRTGLYGRLEIKDYSLRSQITNEARLRAQMSKMAREGRLTGQRQFWINRHAMTPQLRHFAAQSGLISVESVGTGQRLPANTRSFERALAQIDNEFARTARYRGALGSAMMVMGSTLLAHSVPEAWVATEDVLAPGHASLDAYLRLASSYSYSAGGVGLIAAGGAMSFSPYLGELAQGRLYRFSRAGGMAAVAAIATGIAVDVYRHHRGLISTEAFWQGAVRAAVQGSAVAVGAMAGGSIASSITANPLAGTAGAVAGALAAERLSARGFDGRVQAKRQRLDQAFGEALTQRYGTPDESSVL